MGSSDMTYSQKANPNATNSEMDSKTIIKHPRLTSTQRDELIEQYVEIVVDQMDVKTMMQFITEQLQYNFRNDYTDEELREEVGNYDDELYDELVENIVSDDEEKEIQRLMEYTNDDIIVIDSPNSPLFP